MLGLELIATTRISYILSSPFNIHISHMVICDTTLFSTNLDFFFSWQFPYYFPKHCPDYIHETEINWGQIRAIVHAPSLFKRVDIIHKLSKCCFGEKVEIMGQISIMCSYSRPTFRSWAYPTSSRSLQMKEAGRFCITQKKCPFNTKAQTVQSFPFTVMKLHGRREFLETQLKICFHTMLLNPMLFYRWQN